jgi:hypothetical protein
VLDSLSPPEREAVLLAAARRRLTRKARHFAQTAAIHGESAALYQKVAETLGYKANKLPFRLLAQRLPLVDWARHQREFEAVLFGVSGFLPGTNLRLSKDPFATETYLRALWEQWWPWRAELAALAARGPDWSLQMDPASGAAYLFNGRTGENFVAWYNANVVRAVTLA